MVNIKTAIQNAYEQFGSRNFVFTKRNGQFESISYAEFIEKSDALAHFMLERGLAGKNIMVIGQNSVEYMMADLAITAYVGACVNVNPAVDAESLARIIEKGKVAVIFYSAEMKEKIAALKVTNLHMPDKSQYLVPTPEIENYTTTVEFDPDTMTYTFTSALDLVPVNIKHVWDDGDNELDSRPDEVNSELTRNDETEATHDVDTEENEDEFTIAQIPPALLDGYLAKLSPIDYYDTDVEFDPDTNTYIFVSKLTPTEIHVRNIWVDNSNENRLRPDTLEFNLRYEKAQEVSRTIDTDADDDSFAFENLLEFKAKKYDVVLAQEIENYTTTVEFDEATKTYVFTHTVVLAGNPEDANGGTGSKNSEDSTDLPNTFANNPVILILALLGFGSVAATTLAITKRRQ